jgi:hypothetical protein
LRFPRWPFPRGARRATRRSIKAAAYNFYTVAHTYAIKATNARERNQEDIDKAIEKYRAAIKADPEASLAITELAEITRTGHLRIQLHPLLAPRR